MCKWREQRERGGEGVKKFKIKWLFLCQVMFDCSSTFSVLFEAGKFQFFFHSQTPPAHISILDNSRG